MRYLAFIFSLYFILLALLPCQDRENMIASVTHVNSCDTKNGQDVCPPFCTCSCCYTARHLTSRVVVTVFTKSVTRVYPDLEIPAIQEQPIKIWQPPQIG
jgi:hypothetical protein